jgi:hypothetical protein
MIRTMSLLLVLGITWTAYGDSTATLLGKSVEYKNNIGAAAGFITGYGISYRRMISGSNLLQITGFPFYYESNDDTNSNLFSSRDSGFTRRGLFSLGVTLNHFMARALDIRILSYFGANINIDYEKSGYREKTWTYNSETQTNEARTTVIRTEKSEKRITIGGGIGGEFQMWRLIGNLSVGVQAYYKTQAKLKGIMPSVEISGYFAY